MSPHPRSPCPLPIHLHLSTGRSPLDQEPLALPDLHTLLPLKSLFDVFDAWVTKLGHNVSGFKILLQFLSTNGRDFLEGLGPHWLFSSWEHLSQKPSLLGNAQMVSLLAQVLHDIWYVLPKSQKANGDFLERFAPLVDECATVGNLLAVELQRKIRTL